MKQRVISAVVGLVVLVLVLMLYMTPVFLAAVAALAAIAAHEMLHAAGCGEARTFMIAAILASVFTVVTPYTFFASYFTIYLSVVIFAMLYFILHYHGKVSAENLVFGGAMSTALASTFRCFVQMREMLGREEGLYALCVTLVAAWMSDTGGYFVGRFFGKHKLCPHISPKKTVEGVFGGIVFAIVGQVIASVVFTVLTGRTVALLPLVLISPVLTAVSILGDLTASAIKRDAGIKDYGKIMPGHGGVLDRFDSVLPLAPVVYLLFYYVY